MPSIARGQTSNCDNPVLDVFMSVAGVLTDVSTLQYQIFDVSDPGKLTNPVQIYPAIQGEWAEVVVGELCPLGDKLSTGRYVADWQVPFDEPIGLHRIKWRFHLVPAAPEQSWTEDFDVLVQAGAESYGGYCYISDLRGEGVTEAMADDERLAYLIDLASQYIDEVTGRFFEPRELSFDLDGPGTKTIFLNMPIVAISEVGEVDEYGEVDAWEAIDYVVYNRHIRQRLPSPDDRENPKIAAREDLKFPKGDQNIRINGVFGYTEWDGSSQGRTPKLIRRACMLLVYRELYILADEELRDTLKNKWKITNEKTREQSISYGGLSQILSGSGSLYTGDPEIDQILTMYVRPPELGVA